MSTFLVLHLLKSANFKIVCWRMKLPDSKVKLWLKSMSLGRIQTLGFWWQMTIAIWSVFSVFSHCLCLWFLLSHGLFSSCYIINCLYERLLISNWKEKTLHYWQWLTSQMGLLKEGLSPLKIPRCCTCYIQQPLILLFLATSLCRPLLHQ